jgi:hypothetical protein
VRDETTHYEYRAAWRYGSAEPVRRAPVRHGILDTQQDFPKDDPPTHKWIEVRAVLPWVAM